MKLISMTDFVLHESFGVGNEIINKGIFYNKCSNYAKFLKQPLKLEMFVPCDDDGNFLEEPNKKDYVFEHHPELVGNPKEYDDDKYRDDCLEWIVAKEKVLFEGFVSNLDEENNILILEHKYMIIYYNIEENMFILDSDINDEILNTVECLSDDTKHSSRYTTLTENALKQLGL